jgi:hypothetical protein
LADFADFLAVVLFEDGLPLSSPRLRFVAVFLDAAALFRALFAGAAMAGPLLGAGPFLLGAGPLLGISSVVANTTALSESAAK